MNVFELEASLTLNTDDYESQLKSASNTSQNAAKDVSAKNIALGNIMSSVIKTGAKQIVNLGKQGIEYNAKVEQYTTAITTALGGTADAAKQASAAVERIKQDAATTPFSVDGLVQANMLLMSTGESADSARGTIMALSEAVSATGGGNEELQRMAANLQQIKNTGKATAMDLRQFSNAGINVTQLLADYTGKTAAEVSKLDVTYDLLSGALKQAAAEGGRFYGSNIAQSQTLNGLISTLKDNIQMKLGEAFMSVTEKAEEALPKVIEYIQNIDVDKAIDGFKRLAVGVIAVETAIVGGKIVSGINAIKTAMTAVSGAVVGLIDAVKYTAALEVAAGSAAVTEAGLSGSLTLTEIAAGIYSGMLDKATVSQMALNAATALFPGAIVIAAVTALGVAVKSSYDAFNDAVDSMASVGETSDEVAAQMENLKAKIDEANESAKLYGTDVDVDALRLALVELQQRYDELKAAEDAATDGGSEFAENGETVANSAEEQKQTIEDLAAAFNEVYDSVKKSVEGYFKLFEEAPQQQKVSIDKMIKNLQSQTKFNQDFAHSLDVINSSNISGLDGVAEALAGSGKEGAAYAKAIADAIESGDDEKVMELVAAFNEVGSSQNELTGKLAETSSAFDELQKTADKDMTSIVTALNKLDGRKVTIEYHGTMTGQHPSGGIVKPGQGGINGSHADGLDYVPFDGYIAELHKGERVMTAEENRAYGKGGGVVNIFPQTMDEATVDYLVGRVQRELGWALA